MTHDSCGCGSFSEGSCRFGSVKQVSPFGCTLLRRPRAQGLEESMRDLVTAAEENDAEIVLTLAAPFGCDVEEILKFGVSRAKEKAGSTFLRYHDIFTIC